jgi:hypothetical protein
MIRVFLALEMVMSSPAALAWTCPHGQLYRVHLRQCVSLGSALARPYEGRRILAARAASAPLRAPIDEDKSWYVEIRPPWMDDHDWGVLLLKEGQK